MFKTPKFTSHLKVYILLMKVVRELWVADQPLQLKLSIDTPFYHFLYGGPILQRVFFCSVAKLPPRLLYLFCSVVANFGGVRYRLWSMGCGQYGMW